MIELYAPSGPGIQSLSSTRFSVEVYDKEKSNYVSAFTFGRSRVAIAAYGTTGLGPPYYNSLWVSGSSPELSFLTFGTENEANVRISRLGSSISSLELRPKSKNYSYAIEDGKALITLNPKDKVWATINNEVSSPLFIFCDNLKDPIPTIDQPHIYFSAGIHYVSALLPATGTHTGRLFETTSIGVSTTIRGLGFSSFEQYGYVEGEPFTVYLDGGAYVIGSFDLRNKYNITFKGPGILSVQNLTKETMNTLKDAVLNPFPAIKNIGGLAIRCAVSFDEYATSANFSGVIGNQYYPDLKKLPSNIVVKDITVLDTPFYNIIGPNIVSGVKILSPWVYSTDGIFALPDPYTKNAYITDCFALIADDCIFMPSNDAGSKYFDDYVTLSAANLSANNIFPAPGFTIGGALTVSGCQFYSVNNGILASYAPGYVYNDPPSNFPFTDSYPIKVYNCDFGKYTVNRGESETVIRIAADLSSINRTTSAGIHSGGGNDYRNWVTRNITISDINIEDPIDQTLFWIGNIPDPYANNPNEPVLGDRGNEFGVVSGIVLKNITVSGDMFYLSANKIWGRDASSRPSNITFENIKINGIYLADINRDFYISWASGANPSFTNPISYQSNIRFLFTLPGEQGFGTSKGIVIDYHLDRGQLHPYVATLHHVNEQSKIMQASAYYDDNLAELAQDNWWSNKLVNYANTLTEFSGAFPNSIEDYTTYEFGKQFHKLYYDYTHNFARHRLTPNVMQLDGPTIFAHVYGPIFYNSNLSKNGPFTTQYPQYIASSLLTVPELNSRSVLFSTSGSSSGTYIASTVADVLTYTDGGSLIPEFRNSGILSHIEFIHPSGANSSNSFSVVRLDKNNKNGYKYNSLTHENTLIRQKSTNSKSRFAFDLRKYSVDTNLGYDVSTNFLTPEHEFSLDLKSLICNNVGEVLGGDSISVWVHTKPEDGKIWSYTQDGRWVQHSLSDVKSSNLVQSYCHVFNLPSQARDTGASLRCGRFKLSDNPNRENDVIASLTESEFNQLNITFNTFNRDIEVPQEYFDKISTSVHRLNQNYVIEIFSNCISQDKFTLFYDIKLVDMTLNKWSKPLVLSKNCKDYRVDLDKRHLYNIFKYFNEIAGAYSSFGYANRTAAYTSGVYEASGGSRINYVENPEWNSVSKSSAGQFINNLNINN